MQAPCLVILSFAKYPAQNADKVNGLRDSSANLRMTKSINQNDKECINVLRECHKYLNILNALKLIEGEKPKITKNLLRKIEVNFCEGDLL